MTKQVLHSIAILFVCGRLFAADASLSLIAKKAYRESRWAEFFGLSLYLRETLSSEQAEDVALLEVLALMRHCQWPAAKTLLANTKISARTEIARSLQLSLEMMMGLPSIPTASDRSSLPKNMFLASDLWRISPDRIGELNPLQLRRVVAPRCREGE